MAKQTKIKPKRVIFSFEPSKIAQKRLLWLQRDFGGLDRTAVLNSCIEAEYQRRRALQKVGRMSQELHRELSGNSEIVSALSARQIGPLSPADALQSDIRQRIANANNRPTCIHDPLGEFAFCEICDAIKLAESKGSDK